MKYFRLRHQGLDIVLKPGDFVVGRSSECDLVLDDRLVSRRHARFEIDASSVRVEDLGSRNGVLVNDVRAEGLVTLRDLDRITVGGHHMVLVDVSPSAARGPSTQPTPLAVTVTLPGQRDRRSRHDDEETTSTATLVALAERALDLSEPDEAERILGLVREPMRERAQRRKLGRSTLAHAASVALRIAEARGRAPWVDWVFALHTAAETPIDAESSVALLRILPKLPDVDHVALDAYVARMRDQAPVLVPAEREQVEALAALERRPTP
jgi:predicted component of type VI protein secretion system